MRTTSGFFDEYFNNRELYKPSKEEFEKIKEETYYLVKFNYSSYDFHLNGYSILTEKDKEFFDNITNDNLSLLEEITEYHLFLFRNIEEWKSCYTWEPISDEDRCTINVLIGSRCGYFFYPEIEEDE